MLSPRIWALSALLATTSAFSDSSPFFFLSTAEQTSSKYTTRQLVTAQTLFSDLQTELSRCQSDTYLLVTQPLVSADDFHYPDSAPRLRRLLRQEEGPIRNSYDIAEVVGNLDVEGLQSLLETRCKASLLRVDPSTSGFEQIDDMNPRVIKVDFGSLPDDERNRKSKLIEHDALLSSIIDLLPSSRYTILYTTTAYRAHQLPSDQHSAASHWDLKRDSDYDEPEDEDSPHNSTVPDDAPLFEKYQFFTPGLFMGVVVSLALFAILSVAITAVSSLEVSYAAFNKEMGPAAQKKPQ